MSDGEEDDILLIIIICAFCISLIITCMFRIEKGMKNRINPVSNHIQPTEPEVAQTSVELSYLLQLDYDLNRSECEDLSRSSLAYYIPSYDDQPPPSYDEVMASVQRNH